MTSLFISFVLSNISDRAAHDTMKYCQAHKLNKKKVSFYFSRIMKQSINVGVIWISKDIVNPRMNLLFACLVQSAPGKIYSCFIIQGVILVLLHLAEFFFTCSINV